MNTVSHNLIEVLRMNISSKDQKTELIIISIKIFLFFYLHLLKHLENINALLQNIVEKRTLSKLAFYLQVHHLNSCTEVGEWFKKERVD